MRIDINADLGEGFGPWSMGDDDAMLAVATTANLACGFHAGDPGIMRRTVGLAKAQGVAVGAHPGFADLAGFGRRALPVSVREMENIVAYQIGALAAVAALEGHALTHVKTHGALGTLCMRDDTLALAVGRAIRAVNPALLFLVMPGQATERAAATLGLRAFREIYADRTYADDFSLTPRGVPGAVIEDPAEAVRHVLAMLDQGALISTGGRRLPTAIDSVCVHGDSPGAVAMGQAIRQALQGRGFTVTAYAEPPVRRSGGQ